MRRTLRRSTLFAAAAACAAAFSPARAADVPVAAEPIDYVRVCDAFGSGFLYVPGTETCFRVMGRVRADYRVYGSDQAYGGPGFYSRDADGYVFRARGYLYQDSRTNTEYGLLRTYSEIWITVDTNAPDPTVCIRNAYIQFGGLTAGRGTSFYDLYFGDTFNNRLQDGGDGQPGLRHQSGRLHRRLRLRILGDAGAGRHRLPPLRHPVGRRHHQPGRRALSRRRRQHQPEAGLGRGAADGRHPRRAHLDGPRRCRARATPSAPASSSTCR
jgi:hypothetical protein